MSATRVHRLAPQAWGTREAWGTSTPEAAAAKASGVAGGATPFSYLYSVDQLEKQIHEVSFLMQQSKHRSHHLPANLTPSAHRCAA